LNTLSSPAVAAVEAKATPTITPEQVVELVAIVRP